MNIAKIKKYSIANGEGVRLSLYISGCQFHCKGCFNQETWDYNYGTPYTKEIEDEIKTILQTNKVDGISLLGGDPLWQNSTDLMQLIHLCDIAHECNKTVWLWSGFTWEQIWDNKLDDLVMQRRRGLVLNSDVWVDGLFVEEKKDLRLQWCGSTNQRVIDVNKTIKNNMNIVLYQSEFTK